MLFSSQVLLFCVVLSKGFKPGFQAIFQGFQAMLFQAISEASPCKQPVSYESDFFCGVNNR